MNSTPSQEDVPKEPTGRQGAVNATPPPSGRDWVRWAALFYGGLAGVALGWSAWAGTPWAFADEARARAGVDWSGDLGLGLFCGLGVIALSEACTRWSARGRALAAELGALLGPLTLGQCLLLAALSGFAEEAFFRGLLQPRIGWLGATLLFGLAHVPPRRSLWAWSGFALAAGGLLGGLFAWTGNLLAPITAHAVINAVNLRLLSRRHGGRS